MSRPTRQASHAAHERKPLFPALADVELADQIQEPHGGGIEVGGQHRDLIAQLVEGTHQHVESPLMGKL
jgi:hypothetical protein